MTLWSDFLNRVMLSTGLATAAGAAALPGDTADPPDAGPGEPWPEPAEATAEAAGGPQDGR